MAFEVNVKVLEVLPEQRGVSPRGEWVRNGFVATTEGDYPKKMMFDVLGMERWEKMKQYVVVGQSLKVSFDVSSREFNGRWFTSLSCFSVYGGGQRASVVPSSSDIQASVPASSQPEGGNGDIPF